MAVAAAPAGANRNDSLERRSGPWGRSFLVNVSEMKAIDLTPCWMSTCCKIFLFNPAPFLDLRFRILVSLKTLWSQNR
jgi:hypothetical protein